jgi:protein O-GlcNAc transferase
VTATGKPDPRILLRAGIDAQKKGENETARRIYQRVLRSSPDHPHALHLLGVLADGEGRHDEAVRLIRRALPALAPKANVHNNLGNALRHAGEPAAARRCYERALDLDGSYAKACFNLGALLAAPGPEEDTVAAREQLRRAVALEPQLAEGWLELARLNRREGKLPAAIESYRRVLELRPDDVTALVDLGALYQVTLEVPKAVPLLERACALAPQAPMPYFNLAQALAEMGESERSEEAHRRVLQLAPNTIHSLLAVAKAERDRCEWGSWQETAARLANLDAAALEQAPAPFILNLYPLPPELHRAAARSYSRRLQARAEEIGGRLEPRPPQRKELLRLGFVSADFRHHPVGHLCHGLFERLDRERFEVFAYSLLPVDDEVTSRVRMGCDLFRDCARWSDRAIARQIADDAVDLLVDLTGFTTYSRPAILALRPAPVQLQHMGYVNTMGASFVDFHVVDRTVVGEQQRPFFDERLVFLPDCLFPVSPLGALGAGASSPTRESAGLPADRFVLCSFNAPSKLDPPTFGAWMEILRRTPEAVLWLFDGGKPQLPANLRREAAARDVAPERLVFAGKVPYPDHLARYPLADLFIDSFTYNGGATAVDALHQGLPVLTRLGETPCARMGASVVRAAGFGELVATSTEEYVELGVDLARDDERRRALRARVKAAREMAPLFDLGRWVKGYEAGLRGAWEATLGGEPGDVEVAARP